ncbi:MAG: YihY/virulence factor BrkB family protein [Hyphomicrobiales bacterium]|nr:YihY/virulence factor BrkB family protein [Hyphomicrobiales bacterium]
MSTPRLAYIGLAAMVGFLLARLGQGGFGPVAERSSNAFGRQRNKASPLGARARASEPGRGRSAAAPWQIPAKGWKDILWRSYRGFNDDRLLAVAGGVVFFGLLALFPAMTAIVSLYGLFANPAAINDQLSTASGVLPGGALDIVREEVNRLGAHSGAKLGVGFVVGLLVALWSANAGTKAMLDALNVAYDEKEKRSFVVLNLVSLALTIAGIAALLLAIGAVVVLPVLLNFLGLENVTDMLLRLARWPLLLVLVIAGLAVLYRYGPSRRKARWQWLTVGSIFAAITWLVGSALLSWYLANFAHYDATYGSLGAGIGMMMWMWVSSVVILFGAQLNAEIERQTAKDSTAESDKPLGARGAVAADTVGKAQV